MSALTRSRKSRSFRKHGACSPLGGGGGATALRRGPSAHAAGSGSLSCGSKHASFIGWPITPPPLGAGGWSAGASGAGSGGMPVRWHENASSSSSRISSKAR